MGMVRDLITSVAIQEYFETGDGGKPTMKQLDKYFQAAKVGFKSYNQADKHTQTHWCGIFAVYCLQRAGLNDARWGINPDIGVWAICGPVKVITKQRGKGIQVGDVGVIQKESHHFIITEVSDTHVTCIDGNGDPPSNMAYLGGVIIPKQRSLSDIAWYYHVFAD
jgi:hypothetical protein